MTDTIADLLLAYAACDRAAKDGSGDPDVFVQWYPLPNGGGHLWLLHNQPFRQLRIWKWGAGDDVLMVMAAIHKEIEAMTAEAWHDLFVRKGLIREEGR